MADKGIGEKLLEAGVSAAKAGADEIKTSVSTAASQISGTPQKSDSELQHIAQTDKTQSTARIGEIKKELAQQKMRRFQEVSNWTTPTLPKSDTPQGPEIAGNRNFSSLTQSASQQSPAESVRQAVGKAEQGRNFKG
ncbi:MAG TPA: hypothetical protein PLD54_05015 [Candidatus Levybacteria bacterium]|nr:hypothetical protein [Candidatus Levybacteria bacterium]